LKPKYLEVGFGPDAQFPALVIKHPKYGDIQITGRIDRVDVVEIDGAAYGLVIDYKYSSRWSCAKNVKETKEGVHFQLPVYIFALKDLLNITPIGALFYSLVEVKKFEIVKASIVDKIGAKHFGKTKFTDDQFESMLHQAKEKIFQTIDRMHTDVVKINPYDLDKCSHCDFAALCRVDKFLLKENE
ncbi:MAG: PD-(D/E)XK nuclease family protein, partial [Armatimonadetes bacterium]|nr:PD-(D/E)XK nuclease family protein [Armatimonadota bacterium]